MCSDAPDTSGINKAAEANAEVAQRALDWYTAEYERTRPTRDAAEARAAEISNAQLEQFRSTNALATEAADYNRDTFRPLERQLVAGAQAFDTPERREAAAGEAAADVAQRFKGAAETVTRNLSRYGVNPNSGAGATMMQTAALEEAKAKAGAMTKARQGVEQQGYARMVDAAGLGRNVVSNQATFLAASQNAGNSSVGNQLSALNAQQSGANLMQQGFGTAIQGNSSAGNLYGQVASLDSKSSSGLLGGMGALGQGLGAMGVTFSDEDMKSGIKKGSTASMLKAVEGTPVKKWRYDPDKGGPDDGGAEHTGPMAQDVHKRMGNEAAPGGKLVDLVSLNGVTMGAVQEIAKRLKKIEERVPA